MSNVLVIPRGKVYFDQFAEGTTNIQGERYLGNTPEFKLNVEGKSVPHYTSDYSVKAQDGTALIELNRKGTMTTDNMNYDNIALFFVGTKSTVTQTLLSAQTQTRALKKGHYFQVGESDSNPAGYRNIDNFVLKDAANTVTIAMSGNYTVDEALGRIYVESDAPGIVDDTTYTFNFDVAASSRTRVVSANTQIRGAMRVIADNASGENKDYYFPSVMLTSNGDLNLKGDEWQTAGFTVEVLKKSDTVEAVYIDGRAA